MTSAIAGIKVSDGFNQ